MVWLVAVPLGHGVLPWAISLIGVRHGWAHGQPSSWNLIGLIPIVAGAALLVWLMLFGFAQVSRLPERIELNWSPKLLLTEGPYSLSRHPMYIAEAALWLGWAILYGSIPVLIGLAILLIAINVLAAREERALEAKFDGPYLDYKARVPKWFTASKNRDHTT